jgi:hypothetical protein
MSSAGRAQRDLAWPGETLHAHGLEAASMYVSLLRMFVEVSQSPVVYVGLILVLMASWGLIVSAITEIAIRLFDVRDI